MRPESTKSPSARPPIQSMEAEYAEDAICPYHRGLIISTGAAEGTVFWCPIGRQYWRYHVKSDDGFRAPVRYPRIGIV
jgi:hypothetical protein